MSGESEMNNTLIHLEGFNNYYTCPCGRNYTHKVIRCDCGISFDNFHMSHIPKRKVKE